MRTITVAGGNLFELALKHLGDAMQWNRIAQQNGLTDPMLNGLVTLEIPPPDPSVGGGVFEPA